MSGGNAPWSETVWLLAKNVLFTILVPGVAGVYLPLRIAGGPIPRPAWGLRPVAGIMLLAFGTVGYLWCQWEFATFGRGTPAPIDPPKRLVIRGLHRYVRNPIYLSALTVVVGWAAYLSSPALLLYAGALWIGFHAFVVSVEEPDLRRRFGESYVQYCRQVRRWMPAKPDHKLGG